MSSFPLPAGFEALSIFKDWAIASEQARHERRLAMPMEAINEFYGGMTPRIEEIFEYLQGVDLAGIDRASENLLLLVLAVQEIAIVVENFGQPHNPKAWPASKVRFHQVGALY